MTDIFDEVDEILGDVDTTTEEAVVAESESNFNESELQDIMAEIESLEKEFETGPMAVEEAAVKKTHLQEEIERELAMSQEVSKEIKEEIIAPQSKMQTEEVPNILSFEKKTETATTVVAPVSGKSSEMSFAASGQMNLNLSFKIGEETASLTFDPVLGLMVTMKGIELCICELDGCKVKMENGVSFTIPLTSSASPSKKKTA